ncbi:DUF6691 family protein [Radicibacter daui]|uniref:DUF6691 family protein n=1 Tax=Radicibacter daui TaxID=3064829 RepID=UPI004046E05B
MLAIFSGLLSGLVFGAGLVISGMSDPAKVLGFLDVAGNWDPSLALVMAGAIPVAAIGFVLARRRGSSLFGERLNWPTRSDLDLPLIVGAILFGIGWGIAGLCPGPALVRLASGREESLVFVLAMAVGMGGATLLMRLVQKKG